MPEPLVLEGRFVRLEPLSRDHVPALVEAASAGRANFGWTYVPDGPEEMADYVGRALESAAAGSQLPFVTVRKGGEGDGLDTVVGTSRFCEIGFWQWPPGSTHQREGRPDVTEIGWTWLSAPAQRTAVNTETKLLMLGHAFEVWEVHRVSLRTDVRNTRSRAAIERIGGQFEGLVRADRPGADDTVRTSCLFSILAGEWLEVKSRLAARLAAGTHPA